jgi:riboflavin transporter
MYKISEKILAKVDAAAMAKFLALAGVAAFLPFVIHLQLLTGPIINAILILVLFLVDLKSAYVVCLIPSIMALAGGLLPAVLAPVIPFIMLSNIIFVTAINYFYKKFEDDKRAYWLGAFAGSFLKYTFLLASTLFINNFLIKQNLAAKVLQMMNWMQFATALAGGIIAWVALKWLKKI